MEFFRFARRRSHPRPGIARCRTLRIESLEDRRLLAANIIPKANPDVATTSGNVSVVIDLIDNDYDGDGVVDPASVAIQSGPRAGQLVVYDDGRVQYTPPKDQFGKDSFSYTVKDNDGASSDAAVVAIAVRSIWQNPDDQRDVSDDGDFTPSDILLIVNELNYNGSRFLDHPPVPPNAPPPFYDVNGDGSITPADAMLLINCFNAGENVACSIDSPGPFEPHVPLESEDPDEGLGKLQVPAPEILSKEDFSTEPYDPGPIISVEDVDDDSLDDIVPLISEDVRLARLQQMADRGAKDAVVAEPLVKGGVESLEPLV